MTFLRYRHVEISRGCGFIFTCVYTDDLLQLCIFRYSVALAESLCTKLYIQSPYKAIHSASYVYTGRFLSQAQHCDLMAVHLRKKIYFTEKSECYLYLKFLHLKCKSIPVLTCDMYCIYILCKYMW